MLKSHIKGYQKRFKKYGVDPRALQWASKKAQELRFRELIGDIDFEGHRPLGPMARRGKTILDVGCGFGDIIPVISAKSNKFEYTGMDIVSEFLEVAKKRYPNRRFIERDYFDNPLNEFFDIVITSGTLNANISDALEFRKKAIKVLWEHAKEVVAFNIAGGYPQPSNKKTNRVYYVDSLTILKFCLSLTSKIIFRHQYSSKDFTIIMYK